MIRASIGLLAILMAGCGERVCVSPQTGAAHLSAATEIPFSCGPKERCIGDYFYDCGAYKCSWQQSLEWDAKHCTLKRYSPSNGGTYIYLCPGENPGGAQPSHSEAGETP